MTLNCRVGDLAYVVRPGHRFNGRVVSVVEYLGVCERNGVVLWGWPAVDRGNRWPDVDCREPNRL